MQPSRGCNRLKPGFPLRFRGLANLQHDVGIGPGVEIAEAGPPHAPAVSNDLQAQGTARRLGCVPTGNPEADIVDTLSMPLEKAPLRSVLWSRLAELDLEIGQMNALVAHRIRRFPIGDVELQIRSILGTIEPRPDTDGPVVGKRLLKVLHNDADVMHAGKKDQDKFL